MAKKIYQVLYWQHYSSVFEVEAETEEEARLELRKQFGESEVADVSELEFDEDGIEITGEEPVV